MDVSPNIFELYQLLRLARKIVVICHKNPDGDAIGSAMGLGLYLENHGHSVTVIAPNDVPHYLDWIPYVDRIVDAEASPEKALTAIRDADVIFTLDFGVLDRIDQLTEPVRDSSAIKVNIDHHLDYDAFAHYIFRDVRASSTCELIYQFIVAHEGKAFITPAVATCIYTGILTDTASFRFRSASPTTFRVAADLVELGANNEYINYKVYNNQTLNRTRFVGHIFTSCLNLIPELHFGYIAVSIEDYNRFNLIAGDTEGIVNFPLTIAGIHLSVLMTEKEDHIRMSFRSIGTFPANKLAGHFGGGGHYNAAGGKSILSLSDTVAELLKVVKGYAQELDYEPFSEQAFKG